MRNAKSAAASVAVTSCVLTAWLLASSGAEGADAPRSVSGSPPAAIAAGASVGAQARDEAQALLRARRFPEAVARLREAFEQDGRDAETATLLGLALDAAGAHDESERALRTAVSLAPRRAAAYVALAEKVGRTAERWRRQDELRAWLTAGLAATAGLPAEQAELHLAEAELARQLGRWAEAKVAVRAALGETKNVALRARASSMLDALAADEAGERFRDWPALSAAPGLRDARNQAARDLAQGRPAAAVAALEPQLERSPADVDARILLAEALEALGRHDEAAAACTRALQLAPSRAEGWRLLGTLLATHGGALEADRADEALRRALALEPSWDELRVLRRDVAAKRASQRAGRRGTPAPPPTTRAITLFEEGRHWAALDAPELAEASWREALHESPAYVDAAVALFALHRALPPDVMAAMEKDGAALATLAEAARTTRDDPPSRELARSWLDRAISLGASAGWYGRALLRQGEGDRAGALADLEAYVASEVEPAHLSEARALRATLLGDEMQEASPLTRARLALLADRAEEAERLLGGPCRAGLDAATLLALGQVREYLGDPAAALACYGWLMPAEPTAVSAHTDDLAWKALSRSARLLAHGGGPSRPGMSPAWEEAWEDRLRVASRTGMPEGALALAVLAHQRQRPEEATSLLQSYLDLAPAGDVSRQWASSLAATWRAEDAPSRHDRAERRWGLFVAAGFAVACLLAWMALTRLLRRMRAWTVRRALAERPELYPALVTFVGEVRHDLLKHRAHALSVLSDPNGESLVLNEAARSALARTLREPTPVSLCLVEAYERFRAAAGALGATLRPLGREPVLRGLYADLRLAERRVLDPRATGVLRAIDSRLRGAHNRALAAWLTCGPQTRLDEGWLRTWLGSPAGSRPGAPAPRVSIDGVVSVAIADSALTAALGNLLRNAEDAVRDHGGDAGGGCLEIDVKVERDVVGRRTAVVMVRDDSPLRLTLEQIQSRSADRGLGVVREVARAWGGQVVVRDAPAPFRKAVGLALPLGLEGHGR